MKLKSIISSLIVVLLTLGSVMFVLPAGLVAHADGIEVRKDQGDLPSSYCMRDEYIVYAQN